MAVNDGGLFFLTGDMRLRFVRLDAIDREAGRDESTPLTNDDNWLPYKLTEEQLPFRVLTIYHRNDSLYMGLRSGRIVILDLRCILRKDANSTQSCITNIGGSMHPIQVLKIYDPHLNDDKSPCLDEISCEQICLYNPSSLSTSSSHCHCYTGEKRDYTCINSDQYLLFSLGNSIETSYLDVNKSKESQPHITIKTEIQHHYVIALISYIRNDNITYVYTDMKSGSIFSIDPDGSNRKIILKGIGSVEGLAIDEHNNNLYFTNFADSTINVVTLNEEKKRTILLKMDANDHPRALAFDPCNQALFFTNWNKYQPSITRMDLQTLTSRPIISDQILMPNGITIDNVLKRIYWIDARLDKIERCRFDGTHRMVIVNKEHLTHGFSISVHNDRIYWSDWERRRIMSANKFTGGELDTIRRQIGQQPMSLSVMVSPPPHHNQQCEISAVCEHSKCEQNCAVDKKGEAECSCTAGFILDFDNYACIRPKNCLKGEFQCHHIGDFEAGIGDINHNNNKKQSCIPLIDLCSGISYCTGGLDETTQVCEFVRRMEYCPDGYFKCKGGRCLPDNYKCNGKVECPQGEDEKECNPCSPYEYHCGGANVGKCIPMKMRCDGVNNCETDEHNCPRHLLVHCSDSDDREVIGKDIGKNKYSYENILKEKNIRCPNHNLCIQTSAICDGRLDCPDSADEDFSCDEVYFKKCTTSEFYCNGPVVEDVVKGSVVVRTLISCIPLSWKCDGTSDCHNGRDELNCEVPGDNSLCRADQWQCNDGSGCIPLPWRCDGRTECSDESDELNCDFETACNSSTHFTCYRTPSRCIPLEWRCNGVWDCKHGEDEGTDCPIRQCGPYEIMCSDRTCIREELYCDGIQHCDNDEPPKCENMMLECKTSEFHCKNSSRCIKGNYRCNGYYECQDSSDEENCTVTCLNRFKCSNGKCLSNDVVCDGRNQCGDWSDEKYCSSSHRCKIFPYECSQYCDKSVVFNRNIACYCDPRFRLVNKTDCKPILDIIAQALVSNTHYISLVELREPFHKNVLETGYLGNVASLDFDVKEDRIYWTDVGKNSCNITRMFLNGTERELLHTDHMQNADGLVVDWLGRNIYWCETLLDTIEVSKLNGTLRKVIYKDDAIEPRTLVLHPYRGYLFYADWGRRQHIGRMSMSGKGRRDIITDRVQWPNSLAIDYHTDLLYWSDANLYYIALCDLNGDNVYYINARESRHVYSLSVFGDHLYWSNWETKTLWKADKFTGLNSKIISNMTSRPMNIKIYHWTQQLSSLKPDHSPIMNPCDIDPCPSRGHLCLINEGGLTRSCECPRNFVMSIDGQTCLSNCSSHMVHCSDSYSCIPFWSLCDSRIDCPSGSDEHDQCPIYHCNQPAMFQCSDAISSADCIMPELICDGIVHCRDLSDEHSCKAYSCIEGLQFKCENKCISSEKRCDGVKDCSYGEDEMNCKRPICDKEDFQCKASGVCIPLIWRCDGREDCEDGSDEEHDICKVACEPGQMKCKNGRCIPLAWRCDGEWDCGRNDDSDEGDSCGETECPTSFFKCSSNLKSHAAEKYHEANKQGKCIPGRWRCDRYEDCDDGSDELDCAARICSDKEFTCHSDKRCIPLKMRCDGWNHCEDHSDEQYCHTEVCDLDHLVSCNSTQSTCIPRVWRCDRVKDCGANNPADEQHCTTPLGNRRECGREELQCDDKCIPITECCTSKDTHQSDHVCHQIRSCNKRELFCLSVRQQYICLSPDNICDGVNHCMNGEDEVKCGRCKYNMFMCSDKSQCIARQFICDGTVDCDDASDENLCLVNKVCLKENDCQRGETCVRTSDTAGHCICTQGHVVSRTENTCRVINDCDMNLCSHSVCRYSHKQDEQQCFCRSGFLRVILNHTTVICKLIDSKDFFIYYTDYRSINKHSMENDKTDREFHNENSNTTLRSFVKVENSDLYYVIDETNNEIVEWKVDFSMGKAKRETMSHRRSLLRNHGIRVPQSLAYDIVDDRLYVSDRSLQSISAIKIEGDRLTVQIVATKQLAYVDVMAIDPVERLLFYACHGTSPRIDSIDLNGGNLRHLVVDVSHPTSIAVDDLGKRLYYVDSSDDRLYSIDYRGAHKTTIMEFQYIGSVLSLDVFNEHFYVSFVDDVRIYRGMKIVQGTHETELEFVAFSYRPVNALSISQKYRYHQERLSYLSHVCDNNTCDGTSICVTISTDRLSSDHLTSYLCVCNHGYVYTNGSCVKDEWTCENGRDEKTGICRCDADSHGPRCQHNACFQYCYNGGTCSYFGTEDLSHVYPLCKCPSYASGKRCQIRLNHCLNGGVWKNGTCICPLHYEGDRCDTMYTVCYNQGLHIENTTNCLCKSGYSGTSCKTCSDVPECCRNGVCSYSDDLSSDVISCSCDPGYTWTTQVDADNVDMCEGACQLNCANKCQNGGHCLHGNKDAGHCLCSNSERYYGKFCEKDLCQESCLNEHLETCQIFKTMDKTIVKCTCIQNDCKNGGLCMPDEYGDRSVCQCAMGYSGDTCDDMIGCDGVVCRNGGRCVEEKTARFTCECPTHTGERCEYEMDASCDGCFNGGECLECNAHCQKCRCLNGFTGDLCQWKDNIPTARITIIIGFIILFLISAIVMVAFGFIRHRRKNTHLRMTESHSNLSINNPIYLRAEFDETETNEFTAFNSSNQQQERSDFCNPMYDTMTTELDEGRGGANTSSKTSAAAVAAVSVAETTEESAILLT